VKGRIWIGAIVAIMLFLPTIATHLFLWRLEHRLELRIGSKPFFTWRAGLIQVKKNLRFEWRDQLKVTSGSARVRFPLEAIVLNRFPISIDGNNLMVEPGPGFRELIGQNQIFFDHFSAELVIDSRRISEIGYLDAKSKLIEFHLNRKSAA
jgi:hypothetical protein